MLINWLLLVKVDHVLQYDLFFVLKGLTILVFLIISIEGLSDHNGNKISGLYPDVVVELACLRNSFNDLWINERVRPWAISWVPFTWAFSPVWMLIAFRPFISSIFRPWWACWAIAAWLCSSCWGVGIESWAEYD